MCYLCRPWRRKGQGLGWRWTWCTVRSTFRRTHRPGNMRSTVWGDYLPSHSPGYRCCNSPCGSIMLQSHLYCIIFLCVTCDLFFVILLGVHVKIFAFSRLVSWALCSPNCWRLFVANEIILWSFKSFDSNNVYSACAGIHVFVCVFFYLQQNFC